MGEIEVLINGDETLDADSLDVIVPIPNGNLRWRFRDGDVVVELRDIDGEPLGKDKQTWDDVADQVLD